MSSVICHGCTYGNTASSRVCVMCFTPLVYEQTQLSQQTIACTACTYLNPLHSSACSMCHTPLISFPSTSTQQTQSSILSYPGPVIPLNTLQDHERSNHNRGCSRSPSTCMCGRVGWIWSARPEYARIQAKNSGKWMLFPPNDKVDEVWNKVRETLALGKLGLLVKVAPVHSSRDAHLICVYIPDYNDTRDVMRVLLSLRDAGLCWGQINFKTDDATLSGQYTSSSSFQTPQFAQQLISQKGRVVSMYCSPKPENPSNPSSSEEQSTGSSGQPLFSQRVLLVKNNIPENGKLVKKILAFREAVGDTKQAEEVSVCTKH